MGESISEPGQRPCICCDYCDANMDDCADWESHFEADKQYAMRTCSCGKKKSISVGMEGFDPRSFFQKQAQEVVSNYPKVFEKE